MITVPHAEVLAHDLEGINQEITKTIYQNRGHVLMWEEREDFKKLISSLVDKTSAMQ